MPLHRDALQRYARSLGYPELPVLLDNGCRSTGSKPHFEQLVSFVAAGHVRMVFVPGAWVFSVHDGEAAAVTARLQAYGCGIVELPSPRDESWNRMFEPLSLGGGAVRLPAAEEDVVSLAR
ncbi:hypothetical protein ABZT27_37460 [Streptomyces sp. NPDC005389]|uniref:hypothetical protein n=1 Tax=Streptomyces sp. NPDC005389 TaxID=3157040 RepID=UPI0033A7854C